MSKQGTSKNKGKGGNAVFEGFTHASVAEPQSHANTIESNLHKQTNIFGGDLSNSTSLSDLNGLIPLHNEKDRDLYCYTGIEQFNIDIVAIHGINGGPFRTWTHENGKLWLRDFLPACIPGVRIFTFGYDAKVTVTLSTGILGDFGRDLLEKLKGVRRSNEEKRRSIIFVCHSMGGLVVKKAIITAFLESKFYGNIYDSVKAILFLATPHRGSSAVSFPTILADAMNVALRGTLTSRKFGRMRSDLLKTLQRDSAELTELATSFREHAARMSIISFIEQKVTPPFSTRVVDDVSGIMEIPKERIVMMPACDHREICRFESEQDNGFKSVLNVILDEIETVVEANDPNLLELFDWLTTTNEEIYHEKARSLRQEHTCQWLVQGVEFENWLSQPTNAFLWLHGIPGAGKTILASSVIDHIKSSVQPCNSRVGFAYYYCDYKDRERQRPSEIIGNLVRQLCLQNKKFRESVQDYYASMQKSYKKDRPNADILVDTIIQKAGHFRQILIVIDAMDECPNGKEVDDLDKNQKEKSYLLYNRPNYRETLLGMIEQMVKSQNGTIKFLVTSRAETDIQRALQSKPQVIVEGDKVTKDIELHVENVLRRYIEEDPDWLGEDAQMTESLIKSTLVEKANGMFLFAALQLQLLRNQISDKGIQHTLENLPKDLDHTYLRLLRCMNTDEFNTEYIIRILRWLALSVRPLSLEELNDAISVEENHVSREVNGGIRNLTLLTRLCGPLVRTDPRNNGISLAHFSLKEFLISGKLKGTEAESYHIDTLDANLYMAKTSLRYLAFHDFALLCKDVEQLQKRRQNYPFLDYATTNGGIHMERQTSKSESLIEILDILFLREILRGDIPDQFYDSEDTAALKLMISVFFPGVGNSYPRLRELVVESCPRPEVVLELLCGKVLEETSNRSNCQSWLQLFRYISASTMQDHPNNITPLYFASLFGWEAGVELILQKNCNRATTSDLNHALRAAAIGNHCHIIKLLVDSGADVLANSKNLGSSLQAAAYCGNTEAIKTLFEFGAHAEEKRDFYRPGGTVGSALQGAATSGNKDLVLLLLKNGADINCTRGWLGTPLQAVIERGMDEMAELLVDNGADATIPGGYYGNALHAVCRCGSVPILRLILERGADLEKHLGVYGDALQIASVLRSVDKVEVLLEYGAVVNGPSSQFGTAIQAAVIGGIEFIVEKLLERGADPNCSGSWLGKDDTKHTICFSDHGNALILEEGAGFYATNCPAVTEGFFGPSMKSALRIREDAHNCIYLLLEDEPTHQHSHLGNPLQAAAFKGNAGITKILIDKGAEVNAVEGLYGTALQAAASQGHIEIVEILLNEGASPNLQGGRYGSPLAAAIAHNHTNIVRLLCESKTDMLDGDEHGWTAKTWSTLFRNDDIDFSEYNASPTQCCLPNGWCSTSKSPPLELAENGLMVVYQGGKYAHPSNLRPQHFGKEIAASAIANHPVPPSGIYYFEVSIEEGSSGIVGVGFCDISVPRFRMPGWDKLSWGYHGDDGGCFAEGKKVIEWPKFGPGDVIGCGVNFDKHLIFFSSNGNKLEPEISFSRCRVYPVVSILDADGSEAHGTSVRANFKGPFKSLFDLVVQKGLESLTFRET